MMELTGFEFRPGVFLSYLSFPMVFFGLAKQILGYLIITHYQFFPYPFQIYQSQLSSLPKLYNLFT